MKAHKSKHAKQVLAGCEGAHGKGLMLASAIASDRQERNFQFFCLECHRVFGATIVQQVTLK